MIMLKKGLVLAGIIGLMAVGCNNAQQEQSAQPPLREIPAGAPDAKALFLANCASCHNPDRDATGPKLGGALARWGNDTARVKSFVRNSSKMIADGDPYAVALFNKWNQTAMYSFPSLTEAELDALLTLMR